MGPLVLIPCGGKKAETPAPARDLYIGSQFKAGWKAAHALSDRVLILSALHGLVDPDDMVAPYDLKMGQAGSVTSARLTRQAASLGVLDETDVVLLLPRAYAEVALDVWPSAEWVFRAPRLGIGRQRAMLVKIAETGRLYVDDRQAV